MNQIKSFGEYLHQFALSVDFLCEENYENIKNKISDYLKKHLSAHQLAFCVPGEVDDANGFHTVWSFPSDYKAQN